LWKQVKTTVRQIEQEEGCLIFDDTIQEKIGTDENEIICWHFDHCKGRSVKGINSLNALYYSGGVSVPVAFEIVCKPIQYHSEQPCFHVGLCCLQAGVPEDKTQGQPFCVTNKIVHKSKPDRLCRITKITGCVTSVIKGADLLNEGTVGVVKHIPFIAEPQNCMFSMEL